MTTIDPVQSILAELARTDTKIRLVSDDELEVTAPRGRISTELRDRIIACKPDIIRWLADAGGTGVSNHQLPLIVPNPSEADEPFPLADLQTSFLVGSAEGLEYHVRPHQYMEFDFTHFDVERFSWALDRNLRRQRENLVELTDDMQLRRIKNFTSLELEVNDFRGMTAAETQQALLRIRQNMRRKILPLDRWPWFDVEISLYGDQDARVHYNNNNFYSDGIGTSHFLDNLFGLYRDPNRHLPPLEVSFRDCVVTLDEIEQSALGETSERYWRGRIPDWPDAPAIPLAPGGHAQGRSELHRREFVLSVEHWDALKQQARARGLTDSTVMYSVFAQVVAAWSGSRHFLLNNMVTHRLPLHPQIREVLGNFASLYPLEVDWRNDETFEARARRLRAQVTADMQHTHWSGVKVLQALNQHRRTPGRAACPFVVSSGLFMGKFARPTYSTLETPQVLIDCQFWQQADGTVWFAWDVIESMFPEGVVDAMHSAFRTLIVGLALHDSMWQQSDFNLAPADQLVQRAELNNRPHEVPDGLLHDALARRAIDAPHRTALRTTSAQLTYQKLNERSNQAAASLLDAGSSPDSLIPVVLPKGWHQAAAVLGVLTAGGAYVPVDPQWPDERIAHLMRVTNAEHVLTLESLRDRVSSLTAAVVHPVDADASASVALASPVPRQPQDLAYVIYTSGSTGTPKGAALDHRGPLNTIADINQRFDIGADDVFFGISSLSFDLSVYDIFGSVQAGATLVLPDPADLDNPQAWVSMMRSTGVTVWNSVPALMQLAVEEAEVSGVVLPSLRVVLLSGDWVPVDLPDRIHRVAPNARVISLGGATEASIWSIFHPVDRVDPSWTSVPYGKPLAGQTWHVLDDTGGDAPDWVPGHLHIGGVGLAVGYWNDPEMTDGAFTTHPRTGERLYRTGDLGRYLPDGTIEFLGRADFQVKIQGFRVELGEIEHVLSSHPAVQRAVVAVRDTASGKQLWACAVASSDVDESELREFTGTHLPRYMVPASVTLVEQLPLTSNGKVDRRALEALQPTEPEARREHVSPRDSVEAAVAAIWEEVLDVSPVGVYDDFFDLGGQSFAGLRVITKISRTLGRRLSLAALLSGRTVAALCEHLTRPQEWSPMVPLRETPSSTTAFLVHPAGGNVLCYRSLAALVDANWHALQAPGPDNGQDVPTRISEFAERYVEVIRQAQPHGPYVLGGWSSGAVIAAEMASQLERLGEQVKNLFVFDSPAPHPAPEVDPVSLLLWFLEDLNMGFRADDATAAERAELLAADEADRLRAGLGILARHAGSTVNVDEVHLSHVFAVFSGVVTATRRHKPDVVSADILLVRAAEGRVSEFIDHPHGDDHDWGWHAVTTGKVTSAAAPGTHYTLLSEPNVTEVANLVRTRLPAASISEREEDQR